MEFDPRPVYEEDQVITVHDLVSIRNGYIYQYKALPWYRFYRRWLLRIGVGVCLEILRWMSHGKPHQGVN